MRTCMRLLVLSLAMMFVATGACPAETIGDPDAICYGNITAETSTSGTWTPLVYANNTRSGGPTWGATRMTVGNDLANFRFSAYSSGAPGVLAYSAGLAATSEGGLGNFVLGGGIDTPVVIYAGNNYNDLNGHIYVATNGRVGIGTNSPATLLDVDGEVTCTVLNITGPDLSEPFDITTESGAEVEPGTVVSIDIENPGELVINSKAYDRTVAGIVSGAGGLKTGVIMGSDSPVTGKHLVALSGRVFCKVDATKAAVVPGDLLTTSDTPGHAMKVLNHKKAAGAIIGKAMTPLAKGETGLVLVLVSLQ